MRKVGSTIGQIEYLVPQPSREVIRRARVLVVLVVVGVVAIVVTLHWRWVRPAGSVDHSQRLEGWRKHTIGITQDHLAGNDLLGRVDNATRCQRRLLADAQATPHVRPPLSIRALHVKD